MKKLVFALLVAVAPACGGGLGDPTTSTCPTTNPPTYEGFAKPFFTKYCIACHKEYGNEGTIKAELDDIDRAAAKGPAGTNTWMPEDSPTPTDAEREQLGQYLACQK